MMNMMKTLNAVLAGSLLVGTTVAQAASYDVSGLLTGFSTNPAVIAASFTPTNPTFTGSWNVDTTSLVGDASFAPYTVTWSVLGNPQGSTSYTTDIYHLDTTGANVVYDAGTRTLTVTNGTLASTSSDYTCSGDSLFCGGILPSFNLDLVLTFTDATLNSFNGSAVATNGDASGEYSYNWSFAGEAPEVPVPAAVWLFGSGLAGLAGLARSRKAK
jgi:hypothetical protein